MRSTRVLVIGLAVAALAGLGPAIAAADGGIPVNPPAIVQGNTLVADAQVLAEDPPAPGWTTAIAPGGDTSLRRMQRRADAAALGSGSSQPQPAHTNSGTSYSDQWGCRYRLYRSTSLRQEVRSRCYITSAPRFGDF